MKVKLDTQDTFSIMKDGGRTGDTCSKTYKEITTSEIFSNSQEKEEINKIDEIDVRTASNNSSVFSKIKINKPLIPLKIALFCWFAGCSAVSPFAAVYLKQLGLTLRELSIIYIILPVFQLLGPAVSGIVADKIGRSKPVLQANILLVMVAANGMLFIPGLKGNSCIRELIDCHSQTLGNVSMTEYCNIHKNESHSISCTFHCSIEPFASISDVCFQNYVLMCHHSFQDEFIRNINLSEHIFSNETAAVCIKDYNENNVTNKDSWCLTHMADHCNSSCESNANATRSEDSCHTNEGNTQLFILSLIFVIAYNTFLSNAYRIFDFTSMSLVKTYDSNFGRQRVWALTGSMISSALTGYIITSISSQNGRQNYSVAFYVFDVMVSVTIIIIWKLDITIDPPARNMLKKSAIFLKNIDVLVFILAIFVIGTAWGFTRLFSVWYLQDLGASSNLLGLIAAFGCLTGLPFIFTSNWFVKRIGSSNLLVLSLVGHAAFCLGYSFLVNPWWALIYEIAGILTYHLLWVTVVTHSHSIAPLGLTATVIATAGGIHYGIGKGTGSLAGGVVMSKYGGRAAYQVMAAICSVTAAAYALFLYARRKYRNKEEDLKNSES